MRPHSPRASLGRRPSRGFLPAYCKSPSLGQRAPPSAEELFAQGVRPQVPAAALEPAVLPGAGMPAPRPALASRPSSGRTPPGGRGQSSTRPGSTRAPPASQVCVASSQGTGDCARAWSRSRAFFFAPLCSRPGCHEHPVASVRNPARYCSHACRQALRNVQDRERKWLSRGTLDGRKKRAHEYRAVRLGHSRQSGHAPAASLRAPPA